jgi:hypothetical protein
MLNVSRFLETLERLERAEAERIVIREHVTSDDRLFSPGIPGVGGFTMVSLRRFQRRYVRINRNQWGWVRR